MAKEKKKLSWPSILTLLFTAVVVGGCFVLFAFFRTDADVPMRAMQVAGILTGRSSAPIATQEPPKIVTTVVMPSAAPAVPVNQVTTVQQTPQYAPPEITLTLAGEAAFESNISDTVYDKQLQDCDFENVLSQIGADNRGEIRIVSLPQVMNAVGRKYNDQQCPPSAAVELHRACFNVGVIQGNTLASGAQSALETADILYQNGLNPCGINGGQAAQTLIVEQNSLRIAVISYTEKLSNKAASALQSTAGQGILNVVTEDELTQAITNARNQGCHCVIVYYRWSKTDIAQVTDQMRDTAMELTAAGADIIVGTGPSRLLPAAKLRTSDADGTERESLVLYSMGTLLSESREGNDLSGALVHVKIRGKGNGVQIEGLSYTPTYIWKQRFSGVDAYQVIASAKDVPEKMSSGQKDVMERCKTRTDNALSSLLQLAFGE